MPISNNRYNLKQFEARVSYNRKLLSYPGATYYLIELLTSNKLAELAPGQFMMIKCGGDTLLRRPISIHSAPSDNVFQLLYALSSANIQDSGSRVNRSCEVKSSNEIGKNLLSKLKPDDKIDIIGPLGNGYSISNKAKSLLLIAGGIGIAPLRFLAERAVTMNKSVTILMGARFPNGLYPRHLLPSNANVITIVENCDNNSLYKEGLVVDLLPQYLEDHDQVFACGPNAMYGAMSDVLKKCCYKGSVQVSLEVRMGCGFGVCYGCSIKTRQGMKRVCQEGPVFNIKDIIWQEVKI